MTAEHTGELWLTVTELAKHLGRTKSTVSEKVAKLVADNLIETKPGKGRAVLIPVARFIALTAATGDAAKEAGAATRGELAIDEDDDAGDAAAGNPNFRDAQTREKRIKADLAELDLRKRLGELVEIADLGPACNEAAENMAAAIDRLSTNAEDMAAAVGRDGLAGARAQYKRDARALRQKIADAFGRLLEISPVTAGLAVTIAEAPPAPMWGDLDPADRDPS